MRIAIVLAGMLGISGCASTRTTIASDYTPGSRDESVVIGRVALDLQRPPVAFFANLGRMKLTVANETTGKDYAIWCDKAGLDSDFYVPLPPGRFDVEPGRVHYVGTLRYRGIDITGGGRWFVEDESETTLKAFRERYPHLTQPMAVPKPEAWGVLGPAGWRILKPQ